MVTWVHAMTPQERFDATYITSTEIQHDMNVSRSTLLNARKRGLLPDPIVVNDGQLFMWERSSIADNLAAWKLILGVRRANNA